MEEHAQAGGDTRRIRHGVARHLRASGVHMNEIGVQLGHSRPGHSITEIYAPDDPAYLVNAVEALEKRLRVIVEEKRSVAVA